jgi:acyl-CoA thioesterase FadM
VLPLRLPREAFGPSERPRAGDLWRLLQAAAVDGSSAVGWPPERYVAEGCAFIVRSMTVRHHAATRFGDELSADTWVSTMRRDTFTTREIRVSGPRGLVVAATQQWVHVAAPRLRPGRASQALLDALQVVQVDGEVPTEMPDSEPAEGPWAAWSTSCWHTWMDPLFHANHPAYVDWIDEALARRAHEAGVDPQGIVPVAEYLLFRSGVVAPETVTVHTRRSGRVGEAEQVEVRIEGGDGRTCAEGSVVRRGLGTALS